MTFLEKAEHRRPIRVVYCDRMHDPDTVETVLNFRKRRLVDALGWSLRCRNGLEHDEFDNSDAVYAALFADDTIVGCFRAIRTDRPYLSKTKFPHLAELVPYPQTPVSYEISRLVVEGGAQAFSRSLECYAAMFHFANALELNSLVAFCDVGHERLLKRIGIVTRRFGSVREIGVDQRGRPILGVAGEIVMREQDPDRLRVLLGPVRYMEIQDGAAVFGRLSLSA